MQSLATKVVSCFVRALEVNDYYWRYTVADQDDGKVSIENLQRIVERITRKPIKMDTVDFVGTRVRAELERYDDHFEIHVRAGQPVEWVRLAVVKEFWHALSDNEEDYSPDGVKIIRELVKYTGFGFNWDDLSTQARAEKLAEIFALELLYPIEYRTQDVEERANGASIEQISERRGVPPLWVERALDPEYHAACESNWKSIRGDITFSPLEPFEGEVK